MQLNNSLNTNIGLGSSCNKEALSPEQKSTLLKIREAFFNISKNWIKMSIVLSPIFLSACNDFINNKENKSTSDSENEPKNKIEVVENRSESSVEKEKSVYIFHIADNIEKELDNLGDHGFYNENGSLGGEVIDAPQDLFKWYFHSDNETKSKYAQWSIGDNSQKIGLEMSPEYISLHYSKNYTSVTYTLYKMDSSLVVYQGDILIDDNDADSNITHWDDLKNKITKFDKKLCHAIKTFHDYKKALETEEKRIEPEPIFDLSKECADQFIKKFREIVALQIQKKIKEQINKIKEPISSHDHEIIAVGNDSLFNGLSYNDFINKNGDSLYYAIDPKVTCDDYISIEGNEESKYDEYKNDIFSHTQEFHLGSTAYSLLRSGLYDKWITEGGEKAALAKKIIEDINNPVHYGPDLEDTTNQKIVSKGYVDQLHNHKNDQIDQYEWLTTTWLELVKRGINPIFTRGGGNNKPFTIEELNALNQEKFTFTLNNPPQFRLVAVDEKKDDKPKEKTIILSPCRGAHALHALVMYDIYSKDSIKLKEHLDITVGILEKTLKDAQKYRPGTYGAAEAFYDFSHWLLPLTELHDVMIDSTTKSIFIRSVKKMIEYAEYFEKNNDSGTDKTSTFAHAIDIVNNLPEWVFESREISFVYQTE